MYYALEEAARLLQVRKTTLHRWLRTATITPPILEASVISSDQLYELARRHKRPLAALSAENGPLEVLTHEIQMLKSRVEWLERKLDGGIDTPKRDTQIDDDTRALERVMNEAIGFVLDAAHQSGQRQEPIVITSFGPEGVFQRAARLRARWIAALRAALDARWDIVHLYYGTPGPARSKGIVENLIGLLSAAGNYNPVYVDTYQVDSRACEYILAPGCGLFKLVLPRGGEPASCDVMSEGAEYEMLSAMLKSLCGKNHALLQRTPPNAVGFSSALAEADYQEGNRCLVMDGLSEAHVPFSIYETRATILKEKATAEGELGEVNRLRQLITIRERRNEAFEAELRDFRVRDICTKQSILRLVRDGVFSPTDRLLKSGVLTEPQRAQVLEELAKRLEERHHHYQLALLEEDTVERLYPQMRRLFWMVKQGYVVLMETLHNVQAHGNVEVDISIADANLVTAFYNYFEKELWERIPAQEKHRGRIIKWLRMQANGLRSMDQDSLTRNEQVSEP